MNYNIKFKRIKLKLSQQNLANRLGINRCKLSKLENGNFKNLTYPLMIKVAIELETTIQELFFDEE